jgi:hypothetical protein
LQSRGRTLIDRRVHQRYLTADDPPTYQSRHSVPGNQDHLNTLNDPAAVERQAALLATSLARDARKEARAAETARVEAETIRHTAEDVAAKAAAEADNADQVIALEAERKSARDARYAARKARRR